jgi:hypothetical protein
MVEGAKAEVYTVVAIAVYTDSHDTIVTAV